MKNNIDDINGWLYHRIRMCIWKQWKRVRTRYRNLRRMGTPEYFAHMAANSRKGHWFCANLTTVKRAMTKERLINSGFYDLAIAYQSVHVNYWKRRIRGPYVRCCERTAVSRRLLLDYCVQSILHWVYFKKIPLQTQNKLHMRHKLPLMRSIWAYKKFLLYRIPCFYNFLGPCNKKSSICPSLS